MSSLRTAFKMSSSTFAVPQNSQPAAYYQYGPPQTPHDAYNMVADKVRASVETAMPRAFFDVPADAAAIFSTQQGKALKRPALDPPPPPVVRSNLEQEIYRKADQLRAQFPDIAGTVQTVTSWDMLYYYFDAQDLQIEGKSQLKVSREIPPHYLLLCNMPGNYECSFLTAI